MSIYDSFGKSLETNTFIIDLKDSTKNISIINELAGDILTFLENNKLINIGKSPL